MSLVRKSCSQIETNLNSTFQNALFTAKHSLTYLCSTGQLPTAPTPRWWPPTRGGSTTARRWGPGSRGGTMQRTRQDRLPGLYLTVVQGKHFVWKKLFGPIKKKMGLERNCMCCSLTLCGMTLQNNNSSLGWGGGHTGFWGLYHCLMPDYVR